MDALAYAPATEVAARIRAGELTPTEAVEACVRRIERVDPSLGAFVEVDAERALEAAAAMSPDDPRAFAGVPIAIKSNVPVSGLRMEMGSSLLAGHRPGHSAYLVRRLRDAGFIVLGTTRMSEFGILPTTEPRHGGPARNPWDQTRTPGGSSGGSAAAVAAGLVPLAHGNDGGGSLRIPAACCGLVGLKPSRGRISRGPDLGDSFLGTDGVLSRTVAETALLLDVLAGYEPGDATWAPRPAEPFTASMQRTPGRLRIAMSLDNALGVECHPEVVHGVHRAAELLRELGHDVEEAGPPVHEAIADLFIQAFAPHVALGIGFGERLAGRLPGEDDLEPLSRHIRERALALPSTGYLGAVAQLQFVARGVVAFFADYDLLLTPVLAARPLPIGELDGCGTDPAADLRRAGAFAPYTPLFNVTGQPAISVPVGVGDDGLPTAVQLVGHPLADDTLLQVAAQLETARPWADRTPAL
ncbi:MAG TPA: amidase [Solirubrobacteraceae bacterium]|jgi:amidase|nr:amidase [Solirubrobacteraceae bacterium]